MIDFFAKKALMTVVISHSEKLGESFYSVDVVGA